MNIKRIKLKLKKIPKSPGVYFYYDKNGNMIYIGKASVLKHRVNSYFTKKLKDGKTQKLVDSIYDIKWEETKSVIEALILESNLIKKYKPKYNIREKDDKSFVQIALTREEFPRFVLFRPTEKEKVRAKIKKYFGPYTSTGAVNEILNILRKIFTFRDCSPYKFSRFAKKMSPCLYYPLNLCPGPCAGYISKSEYAKIIKQITDFLSGKKKRVISELKKQMEKYAKTEEYEKAGQIRDRIYAFQHINDVALIKQERSLEQYSNIPERIEVYDISNLPVQGRGLPNFAVGSMVVFSHAEVSKNDYRRFRIKNYELGFKDKEILKHPSRLGSRSEVEVQDDQRDLKSKIIENKDCHANARNDKPKGDPQMMAQVIDRRFNNDWPKPNLIILDGGKGQLSAVLGVLKKKKLKIPVIAVAKGPTRKGFRLFKNNLAKKIVLDRKFIERMRDEAHRFAINYQRKLQQKSIR